MSDGVATLMDAWSPSRGWHKVAAILPNAGADVNADLIALDWKHWEVIGDRDGFSVELWSKPVEDEWVVFLMTGDHWHLIYLDSFGSAIEFLTKYGKAWCDLGEATLTWELRQAEGE